jgi:hypothetical protein
MRCSGGSFGAKTRIGARGVALSLTMLVAVFGDGFTSAQDISVRESVLTQHNDNARTGAYLVETQLTPSNVNPSSFGRLTARQVDSQIAAQLLYAKGVLINGVPKNILYVATRKNKIYAFDVANMDPVWQTPELQMNSLGAAPPPGMDDGPNPCLQTHGPVGITSTSTIDATTNTMYVAFRTGLPPDPRFSQYDKKNPPPNPGDYQVEAHYWLAAIDIRTGENRQAPVEITAPDFDANMQVNRPGLLLVNGVVYLGFGGAVCDYGGNPWLDPPKKHAPHGWVFAYRVQDLTQLDVLNTTPETAVAGVWQSGNGLAGDANGNVFAFTGNNGDAGNNNDDAWIIKNDPNHLSELGQSILKLHLGANNKFTRTPVRILVKNTQIGKVEKGLRVAQRHLVFTRTAAARIGASDFSLCFRAYSSERLPEYLGATQAAIGLCLWQRFRGVFAPLLEHPLNFEIDQN